MFNFLDQTPHPITHDDLKRLISHFHIVTLTNAQCVETREALEKARIDGKLSPYKIHQILKQLKATGKINNYDRSAIEDALGDFFSSL